MGPAAIEPMRRCTSCVASKYCPILLELLISKCDRISVTEFRHQMHSGNLTAYLSLNCLSNGVVLNGIVSYTICLNSRKWINKHTFLTQCKNKSKKYCWVHLLHHLWTMFILTGSPALCPTRMRSMLPTSTQGWPWTGGGNRRRFANGLHTRPTWIRATSSYGK